MPKKLTEDLDMIVDRSALGDVHLWLDEILRKILDSATLVLREREKKAPGHNTSLVLSSRRYKDVSLVLLLVPNRIEVNLTERESDVAFLVAEGHPNAKIARMLDIQRNTVSAHLRNIYKKLEVNSRTELACKLVCHQILQGIPREHRPSTVERDNPAEEASRSESTTDRKPSVCRN